MPGPGGYDAPETVGNKKSFNATGNFSVFSSKVPNCKDIKIKDDKPGPGAYNNVNPKSFGAMDSQAGGSTTADSTFGASTTSGNGQNTNPFMSTT